MELNEAILHALYGDAVLFVGSGYSIGAKKSIDSEFGTASTIAHKLLALCGYDEEDFVDDLGQAATIFLNEHTEAELLEFVRSEFSAVGTTNAQQIIAALPWQRIYTTNYDNVFELAALQSDKKKQLFPVTCSQRVVDYNDKSRICIHLNGSVLNLSADKLYDEFKLTNVSYLTEEFQKSEWLRLFKSDLATAKAIFFVGYSMKYDLDLQRIIYAQPELQNKTFFVLYEKEPKANIELIKTFGTPLPINVDGIAQEIINIQKGHVVITKMSRPLLCFYQPKISKDLPSISDDDEFNLLVKGDVNIEKLYYSEKLPDEIVYSIHRTKIRNVIDNIKNGEKNLLVHSSLGNGKTVFIETLAALLSQDGYNVYVFKKWYANIGSEIEEICKSHDKTIILVDDYYSHMDILETLKLHRTDQILVVSERSATNDIGYDDLSELFGDFYGSDINILDAEEITDLTNLLDHYGFWTYMSSEHIYKKEDFIRVTCKSQLRDVLLKILNSSTILDRFKYILKEIQSKSGYYEAIIFMLIAQVAKLNADMDDLSLGLNIERLNNPRFKQNNIVREFVDIDGVTLQMKSSIISKILLNQIYDSTIVIDVMLSVFKQLNNYSADEHIRDMLRRMMTFTNLQLILNKSDERYNANLHRYYEEIKATRFCDKNPHFWLQYAIVQLSEFDYERARTYFDTAYSYAKRAHYDTYQIDNHYARFILENEIKFGSQATCMSAFNQAHSILTDNRHVRDVRYYPYRVARNYYPFYQRFFTGMIDAEKEIFLKSCADMLQRLEIYIKTSAAGGVRKDVQMAKSDLEKILCK